MSVTKDINLIKIGRFGKTFGIKGWVFFDSYTQPADNAFKYLPWCNNNQHNFPITSFKDHGKKWIVKIDKIDNPEDAKQLTNQDVFITRETLPQLDDNEIYWADLIGYQIINSENIFLGTVVDLFETGSNDNMIVKNPQGIEIYIPYLKNIIISNDRTQKVLRIHWIHE